MQDQVDDEPALVRLEIVERRAHRLADHRSRAVAADDVAGVDPLDRAASSILDAQPHRVVDDFDRDRPMRRAQRDARVLAHPFSQHRLEGRLVEAIARMPALRPDLRRPAPVDQQTAPGIDELHAGRHDEIRREFVGDADRLEDPHALAVEVDGARQVVEVGLALDDERAHAARAEQAREGGADRTAADDRDVAAFRQGRSCAGTPTAGFANAANRQRSTATVLRRTPMRSTSISTTSPSFIHTGGSRRAPTPPGVPVTITSPARSGAIADR